MSIHERTRHYRANDRALRGQHAEIAVRYDDPARTTVDEILTTQVHLERLDYNHIWMTIAGLHVNIRAGRDGRITVTCSPEDCESA